MKHLASNTGFAIFSVIIFSAGLIGLLWNKEIQLLNTDKAAAVEQVVQRNSNLALALENYTIRTIQNAELVLQVIKDEFEKSRSFSSFNSLLKKPAVDNRLFNGVAILDSSGDLVIANVQFNSDTIPNFSYREFFQYHKTHRDDILYINKPVISKSINVAVVPLSRRINNPDGSFGGVVVLQIRPSIFTSFYENAVVNAYDIVSLIAPDGITYARQTGGIPSYGENISKSPLFVHLRDSAVGSYFAKDAIRGIPTFFSYRKLSNYPIIATVGIREKDALADFDRRKKREIAFTASISILIVLFGILICFGILTRRKYYLRLQENEEKYRLMFENSRDAIVLADPMGNITAMNPAARELFKIAEAVKDPVNFAAFVNNNPGRNILNGSFLNGELSFVAGDGTAFSGEIQTATYNSGKKDTVIMAVIRDTTERKRLQEELSNEKNNRQQLIMKQVIQAQERERTIIGGELHDNVCQILTTVKIYMNLVIKNNERGKEFLPKSMEFLDMAILEIRNLSHTLSAPTLGKKSLVVSINDLVKEIGSHSGLHMIFNSSSDVDDISMEQKLAIFRIVQEQVNNILKHAQASEVSISLLKQNDFTNLVIKDNGKGFSPDENAKGIGLNNIEARVKAFSGAVQIISSPGNGCTVEVNFPQS
ncbi:MAG: PAS domain S-box protein [Ferruginibacter sp.]